MIYFLIPYFMVGSFCAGAFWEYNDRDFRLEDALAYACGIFFGPLMLVYAELEYLYNKLFSKK